VVPGPAWPQRSLKPCISAEVGDVCSALANQFASWKFRASSFQSASTEQGGRSETCRQVAAARPCHRNLIDRFDRVLEWSCYYCRGREGASLARERRSLEVCGGDCCKQALTALASHNGDAKRSEARRGCTALRPGKPQLPNGAAALEPCAQSTPSLALRPCP
jgi:hypothetical protein